MLQNEYLHDPEWDGYPFYPGMKVQYESRPCTIISIDGPASCSNPYGAYPMTVGFEDATTKSFVYSHQLTRRHG